MEAKTTRFLTQFSRAVFAQWVQSSEYDQFWHNKASVHSILKEAVTKLPLGKLQTYLLEHVTSLETQLVVLLQDLYVNYTAKDKEIDAGIHGPLLNEEMTELELTRATSGVSTETQRRLTGVLALDVDLDAVDHFLMDKEVENTEKLVQLFVLIAARNYETPVEQKHKRGLVLKRLARCAQNLVKNLCSESSNWCCRDHEQVQQLRTLLERIVTQDTVALARSRAHGEDDRSLKTPWTMFYRPEESKEFQKVSYDNEMAKIYGLLLTLAVYFPIEYGGEEETSDESLSSDDEKEESTERPQQQKHISALAQAQLTTRQVLLAAQMRQRELDQNNQWLVSVLSFSQSLHKPVTFLDENGDEMFDYQDRCALLDCVGNLYTRVFATTALFDQAKKNRTEEETAVQDRSVFEAVVCLRNAAHFMRVERKSSLPVITTAMAHLAGVMLPASFVSWLDHEQTTNPKSVLEIATQRLRQKCTGEHQMMNLLLSSTNISDDEMRLIQRKYCEYLDQVAGGNANKSNDQAHSNSLASTANNAKGLSVDAEDLFYTDNAGQEEEENKEKMSKSKKKRVNKKKKQRSKNNKNVDESLPKRSRVSSN
ncbi:unnamed protein product [Peronospora belbahrii]|uniref:Uncharacterized protein n=1 Tax=Peronospora belbahrii TaxID=622444 RepID=A0ABN8CYC6_9STRA|nr:unnamed protein product [Peronospora belbahrii]